MDGSSLQGKLDFFGAILPLPYRVAILFVLGVWAWGINVHCLQLIGIDIFALINYHSRDPSPLPHHLSTYRFAAVLTIPLGISLLVFWAISHGVKELVLYYDFIPQSYLFFLSISLFLPLKWVSRSGRRRFLSILKRISLGGIAEPLDGKFGDILAADVLTSYAKVLGDLYISTCMFFSPKYSSTGAPDREFGQQFIVPLIVTAPFLIRLRQCMIEYARVRHVYRKTGGPIWGGEILSNALKYASALPVIILSSAKTNFGTEDAQSTKNPLFRVWLFFAIVNTLYSFYWDVAKDWGLTLFSSTQERQNPEYPYGLRRNLHFHRKEVYYIVIVLNFLLRCGWLIKLSSLQEAGIVLMEILEVFRRWIWVYFRVENEWSRSMLTTLQKRQGEGRADHRSTAAYGNRVALPDDIQLEENPSFEFPLGIGLQGPYASSL